MKESKGRKERRSEVRREKREERRREERKEKREERKEQWDVRERRKERGGRREQKEEGREKRKNPTLILFPTIIADGCIVCGRADSSAISSKRFPRQLKTMLSNKIRFSCSRLETSKPVASSLLFCFSLLCLFASFPSSLLFPFSYPSLFLCSRFCLCMRIFFHFSSGLRAVVRKAQGFLSKEEFYRGSLARSSWCSLAAVKTNRRKKEWVGKGGKK